MIEARHNPFVYSFLSCYAKIKIRNNFREVVMKGEADVSGRSVLLLSNHISWWDGFWAFFLNDSLFRKHFYFMMNETELKKRKLFSQAGGFSIANRGRSVFQALDYASALLRQPENLVLIYPQGKLHSAQDHDFRFKKGIERLNIAGDEQSKVVFLFQLVDYYQHPKPTLFLYYGEADPVIYRQKNYEEQYRAFSEKSLLEHKKIVV